MPIVADPITRNAARSSIADGMPLARFVHVERDGREVADLFELEVPVERALPTILAELSGMRVAGPEALGRALVAAGGTPAATRTSTRTTWRERARAAPPQGLELTPVDRPAAELLPVYLAALRARARRTGT